MPKASAGNESAPQKQVQPHTLPMKAQAARLGRCEIIREALHAKAIFLHFFFCTCSSAVLAWLFVLRSLFWPVLCPSICCHFCVQTGVFTLFWASCSSGPGRRRGSGQNHGIKHGIVSGRSQWQLLGCLFSLIVQRTTLRIDGRRRSWPSRTFTTLSSNCKGAILAARVLKLQVVKAFKIMIEASSSLSSI